MVHSEWLIVNGSEGASFTIVNSLFIIHHYNPLSYK